MRTMNMFKKTIANSVNSYIANLPADRKQAVSYLHDFIQQVVPSLTPHFAYNMLGYGSFPYVNYKKVPISWPIIALANQKNYISLYVCSVIEGEYLAQKYANKLGKVSVGKSCIRFKKIEDLNLDALKNILIQAAKKPGLQG